MKQDINVFIHRRDFRIYDNMALNKLVSSYPKLPVMHIFIFNPEQIDSKKNPYFNKNCVEFMIQCLNSLRNKLKDALYFFHGTDVDILKFLIHTYRVNAVAWNLDYTPFARTRDTNLNNWCESIKLQTITSEDYSLWPIGTFNYRVFSAFYNKCLDMYKLVQEPCDLKYDVFYGKGKVKNIDSYYISSNKDLKLQGGRENALKILESVKSGKFKNYEYIKDSFISDKTTHLSPYIKFGCVSIREVFHCIRNAYGLRHSLLRQLLWREYYAHATWNYPDGKLNQRWNYNQRYYDHIMRAQTGFPIIDAGIRELVTTGYINNRMRMIIANFITKDLFLDWRIFERDLFGRYLIDYDPSTNYHSWQSIAGVGIEMTPYWRVMNPWIQTEKFDPDYKYIKKWIPELGNDNSIIKNWRLQKNNIHYPSPIVDHDKQVKKYLNKWS
jgi:deoxyribodipyrimidine photo-lyase